MRLAIIIRDNSPSMLEQARELGVTHFLLHYFMLKKEKEVKKLRETHPQHHFSVFVPPRQTWELIGSIAIEKFLDSMHLKEFEGLYLDLGSDATHLQRLGNVIDATIARYPEKKVGVFISQQILLEQKQNFEQMFRSANVFPVSIVGNGLAPIQPLFTVLQSGYPSAIPCVLSLGLEDKGILGTILAEHWDSFPELVFWSHMSFASADLSEVEKSLSEKRLLAAQRFKATHSTSFRHSPSLSSGLSGGKTVEGDVYQLVSMHSSGNTTFAKLENGTYVVFEENGKPNFIKETDL